MNVTSNSQLHPSPSRNVTVSRVSIRVSFGHDPQPRTRRYRPRPSAARQRDQPGMRENAEMSVPENDGEPITKAGLAALKAEIGELETVGRREIAERIRVARAHGDLKENGEYHAAKEDQAHLETRILRLRQRLRAAVVVDTVANADSVTFAF